MKTIIYLLGVLLLSSCVKLDDCLIVRQAECPVQIVNADSSTLAMNFLAAVGTIGNTRAAIDYILKDVNIFLFNSTLNTANHYYMSVSGSGSKKVRLVNGDYEIFVVGNYGNNMGERTKSWLQYSLKHEAANEMDIIGNGSKMPMSARQNVTISRNTQLNIPLQRLAAKVTFNVSMSAAMRPTTRIIHLQLFSCNDCTYHFKNSLLTSALKGIKSYPKLDVSSQTLKALSRSYYVLENMQGAVNSITSPRNRSARNAPNFATYLLLRVERNGKYIDYRIYLGENDTNNFDVVRNTDYVYNIVVAGENAADLRVSTAGITIYSNRPGYGQGDYQHYNNLVWSSRTAYAQLNIVTSNNEASNLYSVSYTVQSGTLRTGWNMQYICDYATPVMYREMKQGQAYSVFRGNGTAEIYFAFYNGDTTVNTMDNVFLFTVTDSNGYSKQFTVKTSGWPG